LSSLELLFGKCFHFGYMLGVWADEATPRGLPGLQELRKKNWGRAGILTVSSI
jgi:hypothetical protein